MRVDLPIMLNALYSINNIINSWEVYGDEGLILYPVFGTTASNLENSVAPIAVLNNWHIDSVQAGAVRIEPNLTEIVSVYNQKFLFHVSPATNRNSIASLGILPKTGMTTRLHRTYPPRIHLAKDLLAAVDFIKFHKNPPQGSVNANLGHFDIWKVCIDLNVQYRSDLRYPGRGVWCDQAILKDKIKYIRLAKIYENILPKILR